MGTAWGLAAGIGDWPVQSEQCGHAMGSLEPAAGQEWLVTSESMALHLKSSLGTGTPREQLSANLVLWWRDRGVKGHQTLLDLKAESHFSDDSKAQQGVGLVDSDLWIQKGSAQLPCSAPRLTQASFQQGSGSWQENPTGKAEPRLLGPRAVCACTDELTRSFPLRQF